MGELVGVSMMGLSVLVGVLALSVAFWAAFGVNVMGKGLLAT